MRIIENQEKKSISKITKIQKLFRKLFTCQQENKKKPNRYISYVSIYTRCPDSVKSKYAGNESPTESLPEPDSKIRNPESATISSQNNLVNLVPALHQFKLTTAVSR